MLEEPQSPGPSPDPPPATSVTLGKVPDLSVPQLPLLDKGRHGGASPLGLLSTEGRTAWEAYLVRSRCWVTLAVTFLLHYG